MQSLSRWQDACACAFAGIGCGAGRITSTASDRIGAALASLLAGATLASLGARSLLAGAATGLLHAASATRHQPDRLATARIARAASRSTPPSCASRAGVTISAGAGSPRARRSRARRRRRSGHRRCSRLRGIPGPHRSTTRSIGSRSHAPAPKSPSLGRAWSEGFSLYAADRWLTPRDPRRRRRTAGGADAQGLLQGGHAAAGATRRAFRSRAVHVIEAPGATTAAASRAAHEPQGALLALRRRRHDRVAAGRDVNEGDRTVRARDRDVAVPRDRGLDS